MARGAVAQVSVRRESWVTGMSSDEELLQFLYGIPVGVCRFDADGVIDIANPRIAQIFMPIAGPQSVVSFYEFLRVVAPDLLDFIKSHKAGPGLLVDSEEFRIEPQQMFVKGPHPKVVTLTVTALTGKKYLAAVTDVTAQRERELARLRAEARLQTVIENIVDYAIFSADIEGHIDAWNKSGERLFQRTAYETLGVPLNELLPPSSFKQASLLATLATAWEIGWVDFEGPIPRQDGSVFWAEGLVAPLLLEDSVAGYSVIVRDATERRKSLEALEKAAHTDPLTGLYNRRAFFSRAQQCLRERSSEPASVLIVDIDHFKQINDAFGHDVGDQAIQMVARRLEEAMRPGDLVCRFGGEEFVALLVGLPVDSVRAIAEQIRSAVQTTDLPVTDGRLVKVTISGGIASIPAGRPLPSGILDATIKSADKRLYEAKQQGRNRVVCDAPIT